MNLLNIVEQKNFDFACQNFDFYSFLLAVSLTVKRLAFRVEFNVGMHSFFIVATIIM